CPGVCSSSAFPLSLFKRKILSDWNTSAVPLISTVPTKISHEGVRRIRQLLRLRRSLRCGSKSSHAKRHGLSPRLGWVNPASFRCEWRRIIQATAQSSRPPADGRGPEILEARPAKEHSE